MIAPSHAPVMKPGTAGWCAADLDDARFAQQWDGGQFEMIKGVLVEMPPAYFDYGSAAFNLLETVQAYLKSQGHRPRCSFEVDMIIDDDTVFRADGVIVLPEDVNRQRAVLRRLGRDTDEIGRVRIGPTLVIESVSPGYERHDYEVKRRGYASLGVPNYWIVNRFDRSLLCLTLSGGQYVEDSSGRGEDVIRPGAFPGLEINLKEIFA